MPCDILRLNCIPALVCETRTNILPFLILIDNLVCCKPRHHPAVFINLSSHLTMAYKLMFFLQQLLCHYFHRFFQLLKNLRFPATKGCISPYTIVFRGGKTINFSLPIPPLFFAKMRGNQRYMSSNLILFQTEEEDVSSA